MSRVRTVVYASLLAAASLAAQGQQTADQKSDPQRPPTFRSGAHFVSVDAYPTRDGRAITGLTAADFELLEDNKPQTIDRLEFIEHPEWTPLADRRDPNSQRDGFALARDPKYRIFVLYLDAYHVDFGGSHRSRVPISETLDRMIGPQDLFGVLTPAQSVKDLMLGQLTQTIQEQLAKHADWGLAGMERSKPEPGEAELEFAYPADARRLIALRRLDKVYSDLEALTELLGNLRDERKNILFFSDYLASPQVFRGNMTNGDGGRGAPPRIGASPEGTLTIGDDRRSGGANTNAMSAERARLLSIDFSQRFRDLLRRARQGNVSFYTVRPGGLDPNVSMLDDGLSNLQVLAEQTDGIAVLNTNDLRTGMTKIANDLSSHYVLGYYTNNSKWDGGTRKITVRLKGTGKAIRARREYRAPTEEDMAALRSATAAAAAPAASSAPQLALGALSRVSPSSRLNAYGTVIGGEVTIVAEISGTEIEAGRWKQGADVEVLFSAKDGGEPAALKGKIEPGSRGTVIKVPTNGATGPWQAVVRMRGEDNLSDSDTVAIERPTGALLGKPLAYRAASAAASAYKPLAAFQFRRTERVRLEWPVSQPLDGHQARLLDRTGKPIAIPLETATRDAAGTTLLTTTLNLAPFSNGDYLIEITAKAGQRSETQLIAIRVSMAR
jgi:VWFA-related protein